MQINDLALLRVPADPTITPDGRFVAVAVTRLDLDEDDYRGEIWVAPTDGSTPPRRFTSGWHDTLPRFSPDGRFLAFLRRGEEGKPQIHVMPSDGGEARQVCEHPLGAAAIVWAPDSSRLAYVARVPEEGRYGTDEEVSADKEPPRRITTLKYRLDDLGYTIDRRAHVFVVDVLDEEAEPVQVTAGDYDHADVAWSPDGRWLAFTSERHPTRDTDLASDVFIAPAGGGDARKVTRSDTPVGLPAFSPDGETILFVAEGFLEPVGRNTGLWRVPTDGSAPPERLTDQETYDLSAFALPGDQRLLVEEDAVTFVNLHRGAVQLLRFPTSGDEPEALLDGQRQITGWAVGAATLVATVASATSAGELIAVLDGAETILSDFGGDLERKGGLRPMEELTATAEDGAEVHGWVLKPAGNGPFPVLLNIHGGPQTQYGYTLFDEAQVYVGAGYAVVMGNPRGSSGYGEAHARAVVGAFGDRDHADLLALLDAALADGDLDGDRVGIMGGSYGGFMTTWMLAHDEGRRFVAGISERSLNAVDSFRGTSDIGPFFVDQYVGADPETQRAQDPLAHADGITAPLLIIHSEQDYRCPLEQAQRLFVALKGQGVEAEMLLFPAEGHELSRSGLPSHRAARFEAILDWWSRQLAGQGVVGVGRGDGGEPPTRVA